MFESIFNIRSARRKTTENHFHANVEQLEDRQLLAGDVSVALAGETLEITGDDANNRVEIVSDGSFITVEGQGTDLNGSDSSLTFAIGAVRNFAIDLGDGSDRITMIAENAIGATSAIGFGGTAGGNLSILTGDGNDRITLIAENSTGLGFNMDMDFDSGSGNDRLLFEANNTGGGGFAGEQFVVVSGQGNDRLEFIANNTGTLGFLPYNLGLDTGGGNDQVLFEANNSTSLFGLSTVGFRIGDPLGGGGIFSDLWLVVTGNGNDRIHLEANNDGNTTIGFEAVNVGFGTGEGNDRVTMVANNSGLIGFEAESAVISTEGGDDRISMVARNASDSFAIGFHLTEKLGIESGNGRDRIDLTAQNKNGTGFQILTPSVAPTAIDAFKIESGADDDRVTIRARNRGNTFSSTGFLGLDFTFEGGSGDDRLQIRSDANNPDDGFAIIFDTDVDMGAGDDHVQLTARDSFGIAFYDTVLFDGGTGTNDRLRVNNVPAVDPGAQINFEDTA